MGDTVFVIKDEILEHNAQFGVIANKMQRDLNIVFRVSLARGWNENLGSNPVKTGSWDSKLKGGRVRL
jgi:hypothetical protein